MTQTAERAKRIRVLTEIARTMLAAGANADQIATELLRRTDSPISAIKSVADATGMDLSDAKWVVHRNLDSKVRAEAENLWDALLDELTQLHEPLSTGLPAIVHGGRLLPGMRP